MLRRLWNLMPSETLHGYEHPELVETIFRKTLAYEPTEPWPEMEGVSSVLDFGGACGRHYKEAKRHSPAIRWAVVETPAMVSKARDLATYQLKFFTDVHSAAAWLGPVEVMHSNGALQYVPDPARSVAELCAVEAKRMLWRRILLGNGERKTQISRLSDNGPGRIPSARKKVSYEQTSISETHFLDAHRNYRLIARGNDWFEFAR
jgi:putative methyltransferase (TIGR04325 family)